MPAPWLQSLPNALTILRIALSALVFFVLAAAAGAFGAGASPAVRAGLIWASAAVYVVAAATDYLDGWLARKLAATSLWGAILDPIADKIAIAAAIVGLLLLEPGPWIAVPGFLILFREMFVSGLREGLAPRGVRLPVTVLAKWKTTLQLIALVLAMISAAVPQLKPLASAGLWVAVAATLWTGAEYLRGARRALRAA